MPKLPKIVSGGQTGADRAALDWAIEHGVAYGGWCPKGRKAEDGQIDRLYVLKETPTADYVQRTEWNVRDSDATVVFSTGRKLSGGSKRTQELANKHAKPCLYLSKEGDGSEAGERLRKFVDEHDVKVLNVAGPRATKERDVADFVTTVLDMAWAAV
jgi:hypothetical protein